jgi:hypothetical protein
MGAFPCQNGLTPASPQILDKARGDYATNPLAFYTVESTTAIKSFIGSEPNLRVEAKALTLNIRLGCK